MSQARLSEIAAASGTTVVELIDDFGNMAYQLAEATFVGEMAAQLGDPEGQALVDQSAGMLADAAVYVGVDIEQLMLPGYETGAPTAVLKRAASYLRNSAAVVAKKAATHSAGIVKAIVAIGLTGASFMWLTEDLQVRLAEIDARKQAAAQTIAKLSPNQLQPIADNLTKPPGIFGQIPWWGWAFGVAGAGLIAWRFYKRS